VVHVPHNTLRDLVHDRHALPRLRLLEVEVLLQKKVRSISASVDNLGVTK
jgi:hypothetical protein